MPPKASKSKDAPTERPIMGRFSSHLKIGIDTMKASEVQSKASESEGRNSQQKKTKPLFRPSKDDTKPVLRDPILRSDPIETEEAVLRLPPFPFVGLKP